ncbi:MAG: adenosine deaminase [Candidatus Pristimantibacillus sp.]
MINNHLLDQLDQLPKIDLHLHLDGSVRPDTIREFASQLGKELPVTEEEDLTPWMQIDDSCSSLKEYLSKFQFVLPFLQSAEALERVAYEVVEQASEQGCFYIEVRFAPLLHTVNGLTVDEAIQYTIEGLRRGEHQFGVKARAIAICLRSDSIEQNMDVIEAANRYYGKGLVAVDLAGDEASFPPELHRHLFEKAQNYSLPITIHAGEAGGSQNVYESITGLGASRIGHGVRIIDDPVVMELVKMKRIPLELCPISNIQTKAVTGWEVYPITTFMEQGIIVTVNTDNLTVSGTNITLEYYMLMERCGLTIEQIGALIVNGAKASFLEEPEKQILIDEIRNALSKARI